MSHLYLFGLLIGWGVAIPIGPMNLEIIRRNLGFGLPSGLSFGLGIVSADFTYLLLLNLGILAVLVHTRVIMLPIGILGSLILFWFAIKTLRMNPPTTQSKRLKAEPLWRQTRDGYLLTLLSPFTILFWASMSSEIAVSSTGPHSMLFMGLGIMSGVISWMLGLNTALYFTGHRLSPRLMHLLNRSGGIILLAFALFSLWQSLHFL
ncbi:MAG: LysE family translocator [Gammaproteobacteria bacterium]|nr:LysE family translocator [Gammaproteobacteria bacterium]